MEENTDLILNQNKDLIKVTTDNITVIQKKSFNYIALKCKKELKKTPKKRDFLFTYSEIEKAIGTSRTNNQQLLKSLKLLSTTGVTMIKDSRNWAVFSLISSARRKNEMLEIGLSTPMCECLLEEIFYTRLDLKVIRNLKSKYSVLFYELYQKHLLTVFPVWSIKEFKEWIGVSNKKTYDNFYEIKKKILKPALKELAEKENIFLGYSLIKNGKSYETIQFYADVLKFENHRNKLQKEIENDILNEVMN